MIKASTAADRITTIIPPRQSNTASYVLKISLRKTGRVSGKNLRDLGGDGVQLIGVSDFQDQIGGIAVGEGENLSEILLGHQDEIG